MNNKTKEALKDFLKVMIKHDMQIQIYQEGFLIFIDDDLINHPLNTLAIDNIKYYLEQKNEQKV